MKNLIPEFVKRFFRYLSSFLGELRFGFPARKLVIIGVTGTSGKSTTATMIYHVLKENGFDAGIISTVGAKAGDELVDTGLHVTTPDPFELQKILKFMVDKKVKYVVLETSSHALAQGRVGFIKFNYSVITNIKRDHLDWHRTWENYATSKAKLITKLAKDGFVAINRDDKNSYTFLNTFVKEHAKESHTLTYSVDELTEVHDTTAGISFVFDNVHFSIPIIGHYNIENILATVTITQAMGLTLQQIATAFESFKGVKGRMEIIQKEPFLAVVNFAHNADSLERSLETIRDLADKKGKIIVVFGSAGLRDVEKRTKMGEVAGKMADVIVVTAEDPRTESLYEINTKIINGAETAGAKLVKRFANSEEYKAYEIDKVPAKSIFVFDEESVNSRFDAIDFAAKIADEGDIVITEGKGHELSLCFGKTEYPFTDQEAVIRALRNLSKKEDKE